MKFSESELTKIKSETAYIADRLLNKSRDGKLECPFCGNGHGEDGTGLDVAEGMHCFKCGESFNIFQAVQKAYGLSFRESVKKCADLLGMKIQPVSNYDYKTIVEPVTKFEVQAQPIAQEVDNKLKDYLQTIEPINFAGIQTDNELLQSRYPAMLEYLNKRGFSEKEQELFTKYNIRFDFKKNTIVIPHNNSYASFRSVPLGNNEKGRYENNQKGVKVAIFNERALQKEGGIVFITEGAFDALSVMAVVDNEDLRVCSLAGATQKNLRQKVIEDLSKLKNTPRIVILFDDDETGRKQAKDFSKELTKLGFLNCTEFIPSPDDANSLFAKDRRDFSSRIEIAAKKIAEVIEMQYQPDENIIEVKTYDVKPKIKFLKKQVEKLKLDLPQGIETDIREFLYTHLTDLDCRDLFFKALPNYRFNSSIQSWFEWDGVKWNLLTDNRKVREEWTPLIRYLTAVMELKYEVALYEQVNNIGNHSGHEIKALGKKLKRLLDLQSMRQIKHIVEATAQKKDIRLSDESFNKDDLQLNIKDGKLALWSLSNDKLMPSKREDYFTTVANVALGDRHHYCEEWREFLESALPNEKTRIFLQMYMGYCLTGLTSEQVFLFLHGPGGSGKSTFVETMKNIFGDYAKSFPIEFLMQNSKPLTGEEPSPILFNMRHCRLAIATETQKHSKLNVARIKQFTGEDSMIARTLHKEPVEFKPKFKLLISGNHPPKVEDIKDSGLRRRLRIIPFNQVPKKANTKLREIFSSEENKAGILAWLLDGLEMFLEKKCFGQNPFEELPQEVAESTEGFYQESNNVGDFLEETGSSIEEGFKVKTVTVWKAYQKWCEQMRESSVDRKDFEKLVLDYFIVNGEPQVICHYDEELDAWCYVGFKLYRS